MLGAFVVPQVLSASRFQVHLLQVGEGLFGPTRTSPSDGACRDHRTTSISGCRHRRAGSHRRDRRSGGGVLAEVYSRQVGARSDLQLGEHLAKVVVDCARAQEHLRADLAVGHPFAHEVCNL
jgi:hypothetical protein